ncbi:hypothetical protein [Fibrella arboris]|uniref:hypothetical protein n=1 Tax=Fibrella arboris TaxID=3242486 RepID=UPI00351FC8DD
MTRTSRFTTAATLLLAVLIMTFGCKSSNSDPTPTNLTSFQGSWKITGLTVNPGYMGVTDLATGLQLLGETCLKDAVITFNSNGTISNNLATQASCTNATNTQKVIAAFFGPTTTYTESGAQATLVTNGQTVQATRVFTTTSSTVTAQLPYDLGGNAVATTYTVVLTKQ